MSVQDVPAWLLRAAGSVRFAVATHEMAGYEIEPRFRPVPLAREHCRHLALWHATLVPVFDLARLLTQDAVASQGALGIVAYQPRAREPLQHLGIWLEAAPAKITVSDSQACELPVTWGEARFHSLALACFSQDGRPVPILDLNALATQLS